jgi:hypothetical protein
LAKKAAPQSDTARKIWLAGIGAYGRAFSEAQETVAKLTGESHRVFEDLVAKGEEIERKVEARGRKVAAKVAPGGVALLDDRIKRLRDRIGLGGDDNAALEDEVRALAERVARLEALIGAKPPARKKRATAKKKRAS